MTSTLLENMIVQQEADILIDAVSKLPIAQRSVIIATMYGVSVSEYADLMKKDFGTVKSSYNQGCQTLRKMLEDK